MRLTDEQARSFGIDGNPGSGKRGRLCERKKLSACSLVLPYPPTVNTYWRNWRGRMVISKEGRAYRKAVEAVVWSRENQTSFGFRRLSVSVVLMPPDRRRRDIDNTAKALLDALAHAGVYEDDGQIDRLEIERSSVEYPGYASVTITAI